MVNEETAAFHEAGHAVLARLCGFRVKLASIVADAEGLGECQYTSPSSKGNVPVLMGLVMTALAGIEAGDRVGEQTDGNCRNDLESVGKHIGALCQATGIKVEDAAQRMAQSAMDATRAILDVVWPAVETVAKELMQRQTLTGEDIDALLGAMMPIELKEAA